MSGGRYCLSGGKKDKSGGWSRPPWTSVDRTLQVHVQCMHMYRLSWDWPWYSQRPSVYTCEGHGGKYEQLLHERYNYHPFPDLPTWPAGERPGVERRYTTLDVVCEREIKFWDLAVTWRYCLRNSSWLLLINSYWTTSLRIVRHWSSD